MQSAEWPVAAKIQIVACQQQSGMFSYISAERRVPKEHPLRTVRVMVGAALKELGSRFAEL
jgi:hypothetical protein